MSLPRWDLSNIYPGLQSREFLDDLQSVPRELKRMTDYYNSNPAVPEGLAALVTKGSDLIGCYSNLGSYGYANFSTATTDKAAIAALGKTEDLSMPFSSFMVAVNNYLKKNETQVRKSLETETFKPYAFVIGEMISQASHQMSPELEDLASDLLRTGASSWGRLQEAVSSVASADFKGERKTVIQLRAMSSDADRETRKLAYEKELEIWKEHETDISYALNGVKGACITLEKRRGYAGPLERSVEDARISMPVLNSLISVLEESLPLFRSYLKTKAKLLGVERLGFYDLFAPVGTESKRWSYEEARDFIIANYSKFNPAMGEFASNAFAKNWIDAEARAGKTGGAYDIYFNKVKESRVFANFDYTYTSVSTLAHELGHAWHDHVISTRNELLAQYPMTLAETASIFAEFIVFKGAVEASTPEGQITIIEHFLQDACQVCVDILCRFYFERELFKRRAEGELTADEMSDMMLAAQKATYGDALDETQLHKYMWAVKGHYYNEGFSFYNYPYAFGQLFALGIYQKSQEKSDEPFYEKYNRMLSITGSRNAVDVAASIGCNITSPEFWRSGMQVIASYVKKLEELCR